MCSRASIILESAYYNQNTGNVHLLVRNSGDVPLKGFTVLLSSRGSRQPEILRFLEKEIGSGEMGIFQVGYEEGVDSMVVQSVECKNAQDMIWIRDVEGL